MLIEKVLKPLRKATHLMCAFGLLTFIRVWIIPKIAKKSKNGAQLKHHAVLTYLTSKYANVINKYKQSSMPNEILSPVCPIWICWFQGIEKAPLLIQKCVESVKRNAEGHPVVFLTLDNYQKYCTIPDFIIEKVKNHSITLTHFSDILRNALLSQKGGVWLDASIYLTAPYKLYDIPYQTVRQKKADDGKFVSAYRWTGFCQAGVKGNPINSFVYDMFLAYHSCETELLDYYMIDYFMALGYNNIPTIKGMLDSVPYNNYDLYYMQINMLKPFSKDEYNLIKNRTNIFKLNQRVSSKDEDSLFCHLVNDDVC